MRTPDICYEIMNKEFNLAWNS